MSWLRRANAAIDATGSTRAIAVLRILLGPIVLIHLRPFLRDLRNGFIYSDRFYDPYVDWYPEAGDTAYRVMLWAAVIGCVTMSIGLLSRSSTIMVAAVVGYNLGLSTTHFQHNRAFLLILLVGTALLHPERHLSVDARIRRWRGRATGTPAPLWPLWLLRIEVSIVYVASATSKLLDADWWGGTVLQLRAINDRQLAVDAGAPAWILDILADGTFQWWFSKGAVLAEFGIGLGLLHRRTRTAAIWVAVWFHLAIQVGAAVQVFSWAALAALCIWVTPVERSRQLIVPRHSRLARYVPFLDWFGRFELLPDDGSRTVLVDDSRRTPRQDEGPRAKALAWTRLPATFMVAAPVALWCRLVGRGSRRSPALTASRRP